ncbi:MAG: hypothetical protein HY901_10395 [Deltaproteobacteria bacterium]|nr:hypothetical protein [Deltaproteobacteria bacterium]
MLLAHRSCTLAAVALGTLLLPAAALGQRETTRDALARLEETLAIRLEDGGAPVKSLLPAIVVSVNPAFEGSQAWYPTAALAALVHVFGAPSLRSCEACATPRLHVGDGQMEQVSSSPGTAEITRMDEATRGTALPARTAIWLDETADGVTLRMIDLANGRIVLAENFDPRLTERARTRRTFALARELDRRARGDSLTHTFLDATLYPGQHVSFDVADQWGDTNANLSGVSVSLFDTVAGVGGAYYRVVPQAMNIMVGGKLLLSLPTALVAALAGSDSELVDPMITAVFMVRVPIGSSNYGVAFSASTNGRVGLGISLMNISTLPFLP